jgi:hypothetical protein
MQVASQDAIVAPFMALFAEHRGVCAPALAAHLAAAAPETRAAAVFAVQQFITLRLYTQRALDSAVAAAADLLALLHEANAQSALSIPAEDFYNDVVNSSDFDLGEDWRRLHAGRVSGRGPLFSFCRCAVPSLHAFSTFRRTNSLRHKLPALVSGLGLAGAAVNACAGIMLTCRMSDRLM